MEFRDEDRRMNKYKKPELSTTPIIRHEACERCGREAEFFYIWNGRKLCKSCLDEEQAKWGMAGGGPSAAPTRVVYNRKSGGLLSSIISDILAKIGLMKSKKPGLKGEIVAANSVKVKTETAKKKGKKKGVSFKYGKPLSGNFEKEKEEKAPESEGLMKTKEEKKKRRPKSEGLMKEKPKEIKEKKSKKPKKKPKKKK